MAKRPPYMPIDEKTIITNFDFITNRWTYLFPDIFKNYKEAIVHFNNAIFANDEHRLVIKKEHTKWNIKRQKNEFKPNSITGLELNRYEANHFLYTSCNDSNNLKDELSKAYKLIALLIQFICDKKNINQSTLAMELEKHKIFGLGKTNICSIFGKANKELDGK